MTAQLEPVVEKYLNRQVYEPKAWHRTWTACMTAQLEPVVEKYLNRQVYETTVSLKEAVFAR